MDKLKTKSINDSCCALDERYTDAQKDEICDNVHNVVCKMNQLIESKDKKDLTSFTELVEACDKLHVKDLEFIVFCLENVFDMPQKNMEFFFNMLTVVDNLLLKRK